MAPGSSRRHVVAGAAAGIAGLFGGCADALSDSPSATRTPSDGVVSLEYVRLTNWTETARRATVRVSRDGQTVHTETLEVPPRETNDENVLRQGTKILHGPYLDPDGDYTVAFATDDQYAVVKVYRERAPESYCYFVTGELSPAGDDYVLTAASYTGAHVCEIFE